MKQLILIVLACFLFNTNTQAQKVYARGGLGYALPTSGTVQTPYYSFSGFGTTFPTNGSFSGSYTTTSSYESYDSKSFSYSAGLQGVLALGVQATKHIGVELVGNFGLSTSESTANITQTDGQRTITAVINQQAKSPILLTPSLVIQTGTKINVYARAGVVVPVKTVLTQTVDFTEELYNQQTNAFVTRNVDVIEEYKMMLTPGFAGAMGLKFKLKRFTVWGEVSMMSLTLYYSESEITSFVEEGVDRIGQLTAGQRNTTYKLEGAIVDGNSSEVPTSQVPFSNIGINAGISMNLF